MWQTYHLTVCLIRLKNTCTYSTNIFSKTHYKILSYWVDSRVGNLSKLLTEIIKEYLWFVTQHSQRSIITHWSKRFLTLCCHRNNSIVNIFSSKAKLYLLAFEILYCIFNLSTTVDLLKLNTVCTQPLTIRMFACQLILYLTVIVYLTLLGIYKQYFTWLQASLLCNLRRIEIHNANLTCYYHHIIFCDGVTSRAQTISIKQSTSISTIAEKQCSRTIPWFHQDRIVFIKSF